MVERVDRLQADVREIKTEQREVQAWCNGVTAACAAELGDLKCYIWQRFLRR